MSNYNPQFNREAQTIFWLQWVFFSILGWSLGLILTTNIAEGTRARTIFGIMAAMMGIGQAFVIRRYLRLPAFVWIIATTVGFIVGQFFSQVLMTELLARNVSVGSVGGGVVVGGLIGIIVGLSLGVLQAFLIRPIALDWYLWLIVSTIGWGLGFQLATLFFDTRPMLTSLFTVMVASVITGLAVTQFLSDPA